MLSDLLNLKSKLNVKERLQNGTFSFHAIQTLRYELHLLGVRSRNAFHPKYRQRIAALARQDNIKLHWGCGGRHLDGWVNVDGFPSPAVDFVMDLRTELPFRDGSVEYIFTEHVLEHIEPHHAKVVLKEFHRILKPGGVVRIIVPHLKVLCESYLKGDGEFFSQTGLGDTSPADGINNVFYGHFHKCMYDFGSLEAALREAGFTQIEESSHRGSRHEALKLDTDALSRRRVSLYVEAQR